MAWGLKMLNLTFFLFFLPLLIKEAVAETGIASLEKRRFRGDLITVS